MEGEPGPDISFATHTYDEGDLEAARGLLAEFRRYRLPPSIHGLWHLEYLKSRAGVDK